MAKLTDAWMAMIRNLACALPFHQVLGLLLHKLNPSFISFCMEDDLGVWLKYLQITVFLRAVDPLGDAPAKSTQSTSNGRLVFALWHNVRLLWISWIFEYYSSSSAQQNLSEIFVIILWQPYFSVRLCLLKLKVMREEERKKCIWGEMEMYISTVKWKYTQCKRVCVCVWVGVSCYTQRGSSSALCCITAPFPLSPTALGRVPEGEIIHCRVCQRQGGGLSMGPPSLPCLGLPLLPARPISSAWHSRDSCTEPEANLSSPHSPDKMISLSVDDSQSQGPNEMKWMPVRPRLQKQLSFWKYPSSRSGK